MHTLNPLPLKKIKTKKQNEKTQIGLYENGHKWLTHMLHRHGIEPSTL
jgi:hypothetical protein